MDIVLKNSIGYVECVDSRYPAHLEMQMWKGYTTERGEKGTILTLELWVQTEKPMGYDTEQLFNELKALTDRFRTLNETTERSRELSRAISYLEDAEDKFRRHLAGASY